MSKNWFQRHPVLAGFALVAVISASLIAGVVGWVSYQTRVRADETLRVIEATGGPAATARTGDVVQVVRHRGPLITGDPTSVSVTVTSRLSPASLGARIDRALVEAGFNRIAEPSTEDSGYYDKVYKGHRLTALVTLGDSKKLPYGVLASSVAAGRSVSRVEFS